MPREQAKSHGPSLPMLAEFGDAAQVQALLREDRARIDERDRDGHTALMNAASYGNNDIVALLLKALADVEAKNEFGRTPVYLASMNGHQHVVRRLLDGMADVSVVDCEGVTAAGRASRIRKASLAAILKPGWRLTDAANSGNIGFTRRFLQGGDDPNARASGGATALMLAANAGHVQVVFALIKAGASVNLAHRDGVTALLIAVERERPEVVDALLQAGADPHATTKSGKSPVTHAAAKSMSDIFKRHEERTTMVLTLHPTPLDAEGNFWSVLCTSMSGKELVCLDASGDQSMLDFSDAVSSEIGEWQALRFLLPSGLVLGAGSPQALRSVFADELAGAGIGPRLCEESLDSMI